MSSSRAQQPSILSFFKQQPPKYAAPPSAAQQQPAAKASPPQPPPPPPPPAAASQGSSPVPLAAKSPAVSLPPNLTALPTTIPSPHPSATIVPITEDHIPALRRINALLFPVNYTDSFYRAVLDPSVSGLFSRAIIWQDPLAAADATTTTSSSPPKVVGGLVCRLEPSPFDAAASGRFSVDRAKRAAASVAPPTDGHALYIQSLGLLAPYRGLGLAAAAVEGIFDAVAQVTRDKGGNGIDVQYVYAHVWTQNDEGLAWYARNGFEKDTVLEDYYFKLQPGSAWVVKRKVGAGRSIAPQGSVENAPGHAPEVPVSVTAAAVNLPGFAGAPPPPPLAADSARNGPPGRPSAPPSSLSFQNKRPDMEWNDLPEDMVSSSKNSSRSNLLAPPSGSASSSRSSSTAGRKKKERAYPTAAFGN